MRPTVRTRAILPPILGRVAVDCDAGRLHSAGMFPRIAGILDWLRRLVASQSDFFTVPTATFRVLYVFFVIHHARRTVLHVRVTGHPDGGWIVQPLREAFAYDAVPRYLSFDNDNKYGSEALAVIVLNERHLHRLLSQFVAYYHDDRTHLGLGKSTPSMRVPTSKANGDATIAGHSRLGGLRHRYEWRLAPKQACSETM